MYQCDNVPNIYLTLGVRIVHPFSLFVVVVVAVVLKNSRTLLTLECNVTQRGEYIFNCLTFSLAFSMNVYVFVCVRVCKFSIIFIVPTIR